MKVVSYRGLNPETTFIVRSQAKDPSTRDGCSRYGLRMFLRLQGKKELPSLE